MNAKLKAKWMSAFEDSCLAAGVTEETIHGPERERFWNTAEYFHICRMTAAESAAQYVRHARSLAARAEKK